MSPDHDVSAASLGLGHGLFRCRARCVLHLIDDLRCDYGVALVAGEAAPGSRRARIRRSWLAHVVAVAPGGAVHGCRLLRRGRQPMPEVVGVVDAVVHEEVGVTYERIANSAIRPVHKTCILLHFRGVQAVQARDRIIDLANIDTLNMI